MRISPKLNPDLIDEALVTGLKTLGILTVNDFLSKDPRTLAADLKWNPNQILIIRRYLVDNFSVKIQTGLELIQEEEEKGFLLSTGIKEVDDGFIEFRGGYIYEIFGGPGAGKTELALRLIAGNSKGNSVFIDTKNEFFASRLLGLLERQQEQNSKSEVRKRMKNKIKVFKAFDLSDLLNVLYSLIKEEEEVKLIILDNITNPVLAEMDDLQTVFGLVSGHLVSALKKLSKAKNAVIVVTNNWSSENEKASLGRIFSGAADIRLHLTRLNNSSQRKLTITNSLTYPSGANCIFELEHFS